MDSEIGTKFSEAAAALRRFVLAWQQPPWYPLNVDEFARRDPVGYLLWRRAHRRRVGGDGQ
jgi:hypothetical protein